MDKFHFYRQLNTNDCGPCCVQMVSAHYKNKYSLKTIKEYCNSTRIGTTVLDMQQCLVRMGFNSVTVKLSVEKMELAPLPAILFWKQDHFVVLYKIEKKKNNVIYYIADPAFGKIKIGKDIFKKAFLGESGVGVVILSDPMSKFHELHDETETAFERIKNMFDVIKSSVIKHKKKIVLSIILTIITMAVNWIIPIIFQRIIDDGIGNRDINLIYILALSQFVLFLSYIISGSLSNILLSKVGYSLGISFLSDYLNKLIKLPISFFDTRVTSDMIQLVDDQDNLKSFFTYEMILIFFSTSNLLVFSSILAYYNFMVFLIFLLFAIISSIWFLLFYKKRKIINYLRFAVSSESKNNIYELVMGMKEIKINNAQENKVSQITEIQNEVNKYHLKDLYVNYYSSLGVSSLSKLKDIIIVVFCASFVINGNMSIGVLMTISYLLGQLSEPLNQLLNLTRDFQNAKYSFERLSEIQGLSNENNIENQKLPNNITSGFKLENVSFKYTGSYNPYVLRNISVHIPINKVTAIVGASGSGKTTLLKLLLGFYYPQKGSLLLNNIEMSKINSDEWRKKCGVVMQDGFMFSGTIIDNITISDKKTNMEKARYSAKMACIDEFIMSLPMNYNTKIGNCGVELSGGQKQRLLIARALYRDPDFIFFDEATSFLDTTNESSIMHNLKTASKDKTVLVIAHRLSTVKDADNIIVLDNGELIETGTHEELIQNKQIYFQLVKDQLELNT